MHARLLVRPLLPWLGLALLACADGGGGTSGPTTATGPDYGGGPIPGRDATPISADTGPNGRADATALGDLNTPCIRNEDCESGWCIQASPSQAAVCTVTCLDETSCPVGWDCRVVANTPPDVVSLCFPPAPDAGSDASVVPADAAVPAADLAVVSADAIVSADRALTPTDAAPALPDARPPGPDLLVIADVRPLSIDLALPDALPPLPDVRVPPPPADAAPPIPDAAPPIADAAPPTPDAAPPTPDAAPPIPDAAPPIPDAAPPIPDAAPPIPDAAPPVLKGYGEPCVAGGECESTFCVADPIAGGGFCTMRCARDATCPALDVCRAAGAAISVCFRNETGTPCALANDCVDGICMTPPDGLPWADVQNICVNRCDADSKCPAGHTCEVIPSNLGPVRACNVNVRRLDTCPGGIIDTCLNSGTCVIPAGRQAIDIYQCIGSVDLPDGYCSCSCRNVTDCPAGFGCYREPRAVLSGDATRPGLCLAFAGYRCPVGASNPNDPNAEQCPSFTCLTPDSGALDAYCTAPCLADTDCPAEYTCDEGVGGCVPVQ